MLPIEMLAKELERLNPFINFSVTSDNPYSGVKWLEYRSGDKSSITLPSGAKWAGEITIMFMGAMIHIVPMTEKVWT